MSYNINDWIFSLHLSDELKSQIKFFYVFSELSFNVFTEKNKFSDNLVFITNDDNVYAFGSNGNGLLGLGHNNSADKPSIVKELCNQQIIDINNGFDFVIALTKTGFCYSWGSNTLGQLGNGSTVATNVPKLINELINSDISMIACGSQHSIVVAYDGKVYAFGNNDCGQIGCDTNDDKQLTPIHINGFNGEKVKKVSCGAIHSLALTESGHIYGWGWNGNGELGTGNYDNQNTPKLININGVKEIVCGCYHSLCLTSDGLVYAFGSNYFGQIGSGDKLVCIPLKVNINRKITSISAHSLYNISIAKSDEGYCYVWGKSFEGNIVSPKETKCKSIEDVFAFFTQNNITFRPIHVIENSNKNNMFVNIANTFNNILINFNFFKKF